jgi:hypothetical protein
MKCLLFTICFISFFGFSQEIKNTMIIRDLASLETQKQSGIFEFYLPSTVTKEEVDKNKKFYTNYFTVEHFPKNNKVVIKMIENTDNNRKIIKRFLISNKINNVNANNIDYSIDEFCSKFIY